MGGIIQLYIYWYTDTYSRCFLLSFLLSHCWQFGLVVMLLFTSTRLFYILRCSVYYYYYYWAGLVLWDRWPSAGIPSWYLTSHPSNSSVGRCNEYWQWSRLLPEKSQTARLATALAAALISESLRVCVIASRCAFSTNDACLEWCKRLMRAVRPPSRLQQVFAFSFHAWLSDARRQQLTNALSHLTTKSGKATLFHCVS